MTLHEEKQPRGTLDGKGFSWITAERTCHLSQSPTRPLRYARCTATSEQHVQHTLCPRSGGLRNKLCTNN